jgi:precorrin-8X/cobalt-precorrin-8 methylmutase
LFSGNPAWRGDIRRVLKGVLLLGHGSARGEANQMVWDLVHRLRSDLGTEHLEPAFLQLTQPDIGTGLGRLIDAGCREIFVLALFLVSGNHHTHDAGAEIRRILERYPGVEFTLSEPLLLNPGFYRLISGRVARAIGSGVSPSPTGADIERESFEIVETHLQGLELPEGEKQVVRRVAHATADPAFAQSLMFHPQAVAAALAALGRGTDILVDVNMVAAGIDQGRLQRLGGSVVCSIAHSHVAEKALEQGITRSQASMRYMLREHPGGVVVVGNAPTALAEVLEEVASGRAAPAVVIGVPVGFVGAAETKERLVSSGVPFITNRGARGGSPVAVAIMNSLLRLADAEALHSKSSGIQSSL